jgi:hypothetical protein
MRAMTEKEKTYWRPPAERMNAIFWTLAVVLLCGVAMTGGSAYECFYAKDGAANEHGLIFLIGMVIGACITLAGICFILSTSSYGSSTKC